jgi:A/G-specific adenine glycosylase
MKTVKSQKKHIFRHRIWHWYKNHAPILSWRETCDPYAVFVSEVMLQQTQIPRVQEKYPQFLKHFPTIVHLSRASLSRVLSEWQGMGYNRRGMYLHRAAEIMQKKYNSTVPKTIQELEALPGIGPYSARAILCFAHNICEPFIETNIRRVIIHEFFPKKEQVHDVEIFEILRAVEPRTKKREWYYALMDYGRDGLKSVPNPNRRSKGYVKQSKFKGSNRYIRAQIVKYILANKKATKEDLFISLKKDKHIVHLPEKRFSTILITLEQDSLLIKSDAIYSIKET